MTEKTASGAGLGATGEVLYEVRGPKTLMEMTWEEVEEARQETDIVLINVGSIEEHGLHLPLGTDSFQGTEVLKITARLLAEEGIRVVVGPTIPFGLNPGAMSYPGSITVEPETLKALLKDVCRSLHRHGFRQVVLFLGHDENYGTMMVAAQELTWELGMNVLCTNPMPALKAAEKKELALKAPDGHAGAGETSRALALHPGLVKLDRARVWEGDLRLAPAGQPLAGGDPPLLGGGVYRPMRELTMYSRDAGHPGQTGDPRLAQAEAGVKAYLAMARWVADVVKRDCCRR